MQRRVVGLRISASVFLAAALWSSGRSSLPLPVGGDPAAKGDCIEGQGISCYSGPAGTENVPDFYGLSGGTGDSFDVQKVRFAKVTFPTPRCL